MQEAVPVFYPVSVAAWREWLAENHLSATAVWLVFYRKGATKPSITWSEAVDVALCYGWIDSKKIKIDPETSHQFFSRRKPKSTWSKINKDKVDRLLEQGLMAPAGLAAVETARQNGSWTILDGVEALEMPEDLEAALRAKPGAADYFQGLSRSVRKAMLQWLVLARRPETRQKRIEEIAALAGERKKPKPF